MCPVRPFAIFIVLAESSLLIAHKEKTLEFLVPGSFEFADVNLITHHTSQLIPERLEYYSCDHTHVTRRMPV